MALEQKRCAGGRDRLQQRLAAVEERDPPVAFTRDRLHHTLLEPAYGQLRLRPQEVFERSNPRRDGFGQELADAANAEVHHARHIVMTRDQAPEPASHDQRDDQRGSHPHVLEILDMNGRGAPQVAERHVELTLRQRRERGVERNWLELHVGDDAHAVALVKLARDLGNIRRRVSVSKIGLELGFSPLREHLAMPFVVEPVDHDAVVTGQILEDLGRLVRQCAKRGRGDDRLKRFGDEFGAICTSRGSLELDDEATGRRAMGEAIESRTLSADGAAQCNRYRREIRALVDRNGSGECRRDCLE